MAFVNDPAALACAGLDAAELAALPPGEMRRLLAEVVAHSPDLTLALTAKHLLGTKTEER